MTSSEQNSLLQSRGEPIFILAADHRESFQQMYGLEESQAGLIRGAKDLICEALIEARASLSGGVPGILIDERFGASAARRAKELGILLAMPVEKSLQEVFDLEFGTEWTERVEMFDPDFVKALVFYNPEGSQAANQTQLERLQQVSLWLDAEGRSFMLEILIPSTPEQLERLGSRERYDVELRPTLACTTIEEMHAAGIRPEVWKVEGTYTRRDARLIAESATLGGKEGVRCVVLGRGADDLTVDNWIRTAAPVPGYGGFAIGRTVWSEAVKLYLKEEVDQQRALEMIRTSYLRLTELYLAASSAAAATSPSDGAPTPRG